MNSRLPAGSIPLASLFQFSKKRKFGQSPKENILLTLFSVILPSALALRKEVPTEIPTCTCVYDQLTKQIAHLNCCNYNPQHTGYKTKLEYSHPPNSLKITEQV